MAAIIASSVHLLPDLPFKTKASPLSIRPDNKGIFGHLSVDDTVLVRACTSPSAIFYFLSRSDELQ